MYEHRRNERGHGLSMKHWEKMVASPMAQIHRVASMQPSVNRALVQLRT